MPASHVTKRYGVSDAKVYPISQDDSLGYAYGAGIDVPGIKSVTIDSATATKELRGDNALLDSLQALTGITGTIAFAKDSLDVTAAALGLEVADAGNTATLVVPGTAFPVPIRFEAIAAMSDFVTGGVKMALPKITMIPLMGLAEEDYATHSVSYAAAPTVFDFDGDGTKWIEILHSTDELVLSA